MFKIICVYEYDCIYFRFENWLKTEKDLSLLKLTMFHLNNNKMNRDERLKFLKSIRNKDVECLINRYYNQKCLVHQDSLNLMSFEYSDEKYNILFNEKNDMGYECYHCVDYYGTRTKKKKYIWETNIFNFIKDKIDISLIDKIVGPDTPF